MKGILLNSDNDLQVQNGTLAIGNITMQCVGIVLGMNAGEWKADPVLGPGLVRLIRSDAQPSEIESIVRLHLGRIGIDYNDIKEFIRINGQ